MIEAKEVQRYINKSLPALVRLADEHFNRFIRIRDKDKRCPCCGRPVIENAMHFYSAGHYKALRYNENNVHGGCIRCNQYLSGNLNEYRLSLPDIIGEEALLDLDRLAKLNQRNGFKWDRMALIETIITYKNKNHGN